MSEMHDRADDVLEIIQEHIDVDDVVFKAVHAEKRCDDEPMHIVIMTSIGDENLPDLGYRLQAIFGAIPDITLTWMEESIDPEAPKDEV
jgi:hypothetical protein